MTIERFALLVEKLLDYMDEQSIGATTIYWQGGEVLTIAPERYERALEITETLSASRGRKIVNEIQTNLIGYSERWNTVLRTMFRNDVGSSLDFPNLYRKVAGRGPDSFNDLWIRRYREATANGIKVGVISIPNRETFKIGAERFYSYYIDEIGLDGFQINTPFPGGAGNATKEALPLDASELSRFYIELIDVWLERGYSEGIDISPFAEFLEYFVNDNYAGRGCVWGMNCADHFLCIDPMGNVSQCDCWVASCPEFWFGNIFSDLSLSKIVQSPARRRIKDRPVKLIQNGDCVDCDYLALCHGGCPIRAYSTYGDPARKDPYCETYKVLFTYTNKVAGELSRNRSSTVKGRARANARSSE